MENQPIFFRCAVCGEKSTFEQKRVDTVLECGSTLFCSNCGGEVVISLAPRKIIIGGIKDPDRVHAINS